MKQCVLALLAFLGCTNVPPAFSVADRRILPPATFASNGEPITQKTMPAALQTSAVILPTRPSIREARLSNGVRVLGLELQGMPTESVSMIVRRGAVDAKPGVADLYARTILPFEELGRLAYVGAQLRRSVQSESIVLQASLLAALTGTAVSVFAHALAEPGFANDTLVERAKQERIAAHHMRMETPVSMARGALLEQLFGKASPYAVDEQQVPESTLALDEADLEAFHSHVSAANITLAFVGALPFEHCVESAQRQFGRLGRAEASRRPVQIQKPEQAQIVILDRPHASQSTLAIGFLGASSHDPNRATLDVLGGVLARGLSGRLALKIRQEHGFTYGVTTTNLNLHDAGAFMLQSSVETAKTADTLRIIFSELETLGNQSLTQDEVERAIAGVTSDSLAEVLHDLAQLGVSIDTFERQPKAASVTPEMVQRTAHVLLEGSKVQIVIVGDAETIEKPLRALNLAAVVVKNHE